MAITYRLTTFGFQQGRPRGPAHALMAGLLEGDPEDIERLAVRVLDGERLALAGGLDKVEGERLRKALAGVGIESKLYPESLSLLPVELEPEAPKTYRCPACSHEQELDPLAPDTCKSCGVIGSKYDEVREIKDVLDAERRKLKARIGEAEAAEIESKRQREHERLREIGRKRAEQQLGITRLTKLKALLHSPGFAPVAGGVAIAVLAGIGIWQYRVHQPPAPSGPAIAAMPAAGTSAPAAAATGNKRAPGTAPSEVEQAIVAAEAGNDSGRAGLTPQQAVDAVGRLTGQRSGGAAAASTAPASDPASASAAVAAPLQGIADDGPVRLTAGLLDTARLAQLPPAGIDALPLPQRPEALLELARFARERRDFDGASRALAAAERHANGPHGTVALADAVVLEHIALELAQLSQPVTAAGFAAVRQRIGALISDAARADAHLLFAAQAPTPGLALADFERARDFVRLTEPAEARVAISGRYARALLLAGRSEPGQQEFVLARSLADGLPDRQARADALVLLARLQAEGGDLAGAERLRARPGEVAAAAAVDAQWLAARGGLRAAAGEVAAARVDIAAAYDRLSVLADAPAADGLLYLARRLQAAGDTVGADRLLAGALARYAHEDASIATAVPVEATVVPVPVPAGDR